jgi:hypothetical protein
VNRWPRTINLAVVLSLLVACQTAPTPTGTPHLGHEADPATDAIKAELTQRLGMTFSSAGPHHQLGRSGNGVQLDLVGVPPQQVILSVPAGEPGRIAALASPYLPYLPRLLATQRNIGADLLNESLLSWDGRTVLDKQRSADGISAHLTSTTDPAYVVLDVHRD